MPCSVCATRYATWPNKQRTATNTERPCDARGIHTATRASLPHRARDQREGGVIWGGFSAGGYLKARGAQVEPPGEVRRLLQEGGVRAPEHAPVHHHARALRREQAVHHGDVLCRGVGAPRQAEHPGGQAPRPPRAAPHAPGVAQRHRQRACTSTNTSNCSE
eukprot:1176501-Prorocentrum_minimum.AAC.2